MEIKISVNPNGTLNIVSGCRGPMSTIHVLRQVITALEQGAMQAEQTAGPAISVPDAGLQERLLARGGNGVG